MRNFNAVQLVVLFAILPFLIDWLHARPFPYRPALIWLAVATDVVEFGFLVAFTADAIKNS